jgi:chromosome segregation ATPase
MKKSHSTLIDKAKDLNDKIEINEIKANKKIEDSIEERNKIKICNELVKVYMNQESEILGEINDIKDKITETDDNFTREIDNVDHEKFNREIEEIEAEEQLCVEKLQIMRKELVELEEKQEKNRIDVTNLLAEIKSKNDETEELTSAIAGHSENMKQMVDSNNSMLKEKGEKNESLNIYYAEIKITNDEKIKLKNEMENDIKLKRDTIRDINDEISKKQSEYKSLELAKVDLNSKQTKLESDVKDKNEIVNMKESDLKERQGILSTLYKEIDNQRSKVTSFQPRDTMDELVNKSNVELKEFQKMTNQVKNEINSIRKQV